MHHTMHNGSVILHLILVNGYLRIIERLCVQRLLAFVIGPKVSQRSDIANYIVCCIYLIVSAGPKKSIRIRLPYL